MSARTTRQREQAQDVHSLQAMVNFSMGQMAKGGTTRVGAIVAMAASELMLELQGANPEQQHEWRAGGALSMLEALGVTHEEIEEQKDAWRAGMSAAPKLRAINGGKG